MATADDRPLNRNDLNLLALAALGGALEFYDFIIYVYFAGVIGDVFFPPEVPGWLRQVQAFGIFAAGYVLRPLGGIVLAHFADVLGRKRMFILSVMLMAVPTLAIGMLPTHATIGMAAPMLLLLMRLLQGAAVGGEVAGAWVFVSEHVPGRRIGLACGALTTGLTAGILAGSLVATWTHAAYSDAEIADHAWRTPFIAGGAFGIASVFLRSWLRETPIFEAIRRRSALSREIPVRAVLRDNRAAVGVSMVLTAFLASGLIVVVLMMPTLMQKVFQVPARDALLGNSGATVMLAVGTSAFGALADRFGHARVLRAGSLALLVAFAAFHLSLAHGATFASWASLYAATGFFLGVVGVVPSAMVTIFPAKVRVSGISFSYNVAYAVLGGLTPIAMSALIVVDRLAPVWWMVAIALVACIAVGSVARLAREAEASDDNVLRH